MPISTQNVSLIAALRDPETHFPILMSASGPKRRHDLMTRLAQMAQGLEQGAIPNVLWQDVKHSTGQAIHKAWTAAISDVFFFAGKWEHLSETVRQIDYQITSPSGLHELKLSHTKFNRLIANLPNALNEPALAAMNGFFVQHAPLYEAAEQLKTLAVKRRVKTPEEREADARYVPPMVDQDAEKMLKKALETVTAKHYTAMVAMFNQNLMAELNAHLDYLMLPHEERQAHRRFVPGGVIAGACVVWEGSSYHHQIPTLKLDTPAIVHRHAVREADHVRDHFLDKNMRKLASIIDGKGGLQRIEVVGSNLSLRGLTGTLRVSFADTSRFEVMNSVVRATSPLGKSFFRYPLTFHHVRMPDGSTPGKLSEEWMNTVFVPAGKPVATDHPGAALGDEAQAMKDAFTAPPSASRRALR